MKAWQEFSLLFKQLVTLLATSGLAQWRTKVFKKLSILYLFWIPQAAPCDSQKYWK
jgi:hypothetical protein